MIKRFFVRILATVGFVTLLFAISIGVLVWQFMPTEERLPERMILTLDLRHGLEEKAGSRSLPVLDLSRSLTLAETVLAIDKASRHDDVTGLIARIDGSGPGFAQTQEVRNAIMRFRENGKFALAYATSFGEFDQGTIGYYLASAFDEIHLQPLGAVGLTGLYLETPLLKGVFDQVGVQPSGDRRGPYKTATNMFTESALTDEHRESLEWLITSLDEQIRTGIATGRNLDQTTIDTLIDGGPYGARDAVHHGLVDRLSYWDELLDIAREKAGQDAEMISHQRFAETLPATETTDNVVALITGVGQIQEGGSNDGPGGFVMGADTIAKAVDDAADASDVKAILFRIDSGGGSVVASETIAREVRRAIDRGKPVIVSMGNAAASGGYWIAMDATKIVADPGTLTGSIGVLAGKPVLNALWQKLGVNWGVVGRGANASMWSTNEDYSEFGRERLETFLDDTYEAFTTGVARGRGLSEKEVSELAEGRVWTGVQAKELGLVDELGGFAKALDVTRAELGLDQDETIELRTFPAPKPPWEQAIDLIENPLIMLGVLSDWLALAAPSTLSAPTILIR